MPIRHSIKPRHTEIAPGFAVRRSLPSLASRSVGPFVFFDHFGPVDAKPGDNHDVRPHPHIGLATVTYLFEGAQLHRDSIGSVQRIEPGAVNWMTAGRGIVHSERTPPDLVDKERRMNGLQLWVGLPYADEEAPPSFQHAAAADIPLWKDGATRVRVLLGTFDGLRSPVKTFAPTQYLDVTTSSARFTLPADFGDGQAERAIYALDPGLEVDGEPVAAEILTVLEPGVDTLVTASGKVRYVVIGGAPLDGHRHMWWNFVSSRKERIEEAKRAWAAMSMGTIPGDDEDWIALPDDARR
jgi:redox-sensitive bicupin YhaK (pirin superfamily)